VPFGTDPMRGSTMMPTKPEAKPAIANFSTGSRSLELSVGKRVGARAARTRGGSIPAPHKTIPRLAGLVGARIERAVTC
jgi:hypothetical protein